MSATVTLWPIISALVKASVFLGIDAGLWQPINDQQKIFLSEHFQKKEQLKLFNPQEIRYWASSNHEELNSILAAEGFSIRLEKFPKKGECFGIVAILDVFIEWLKEGQKGLSIIDTDTEKKYPAACIESGVTLHSSGNHSHPIVAIRTKNDDIVYMTIADESLEGFDLMNKINSIKSAMKRHSTEGIVTFPCVDLDQEVDCAWLLGMTLGGHFISQAKQQTKLKMNEQGVHVKSAAGLGMATCVLRNPREITIDKPFYMWIERFSEPILVAYINQDHWKDPKNLDL